MVQRLDPPGSTQARLVIAGGLDHRLVGNRADRDVVGMPVDAVRAEGNDDARSQLPDLAGDVGNGLDRRNIDQCAGMLVLLRAGHAGVAVSEEPELGQASHAHRASQLLLADGGQRVPCRKARIAYLADLATSRADEAGCEPLVVGEQHRSGVPERFVVGVGKDPEQVDLCCHRVVVHVSPHWDSAASASPLRAVSRRSCRWRACA